MQLNNTAYFSALSTRELEIIRLLALGFADNAIAERLFISSWTVKDHRKSILKKLNAKN